MSQLPPFLASAAWEAVLGLREFPFQRLKWNDVMAKSAMKCEGVMEGNEGRLQVHRSYKDYEPAEAQKESCDKINLASGCHLKE